VTLLEFTRKAGLVGHRYAAAATLVAPDTGALAQELRLMKTGLLDWFGSRGDTGDVVQITVSCPCTLHPVAEQALRRVVMQETDLAAPLARRVVTVSLLDEAGSVRRELTWDRGLPRA
jgi:hypothetical protein